jgi:hypothetical protein
MPTYTATAPDGTKLSATGPTPPSEAEWDQIFAAASGKPSAPFDAAASRAQLAAANRGYDANAALNAEQNKSMLGHIADQFTLGKMAERGVEGAKGYGEGVVGGAAGLVAGAVAAPLYAAGAILNPRETVEKAKNALGMGAALAYAAGQDPVETSNKIWDTFAQFASDPRNVGRAAGAYVGAEGVMRSPVGQASKELTKKIASAVVNKIPGVAEWRAERAAAQAAQAGAGPAAGAAPAPPTPPMTPAPGPTPVAPPAAPPPVVTVPPVTAPAASATNVEPPPSLPTPQARAAVPVIRGMTTDQFQAVAQLPLEERQLYLRLRQVGDSHAESMRTLDYARESQQLRAQAQTARAMVGKEKAASDLFGTSSPEAQQKLLELAPGPSRRPLAGEMAGLDARFKAMLADPRAAWLLPLLGGGAGLGALAQRRETQ